MSARRLSRAIAAVALAIAASLFGCATTGTDSNDPCAKAVERVTNECGFEVDGADAGVKFNCTGSAGCAADCLITTSCEDIKNNGPPFKACLAACQK